MPQPIRFRLGFTLIELLVVLSIIGILAGLLMPAIGSVRESAHQLTCANKLRQIGMAHAGYQSDWQGYLAGRQSTAAPYPVINGVLSGLTPYVRLSDYLGYDPSQSPKPLDGSPYGRYLTCPKNPKGIFFGHMASWPINGHVDSNPVNVDLGQPYRLSQFTSPSGKIYAMDGCDSGDLYLRNWGFYSNPVSGNISLRHRGLRITFPNGNSQYIKGVANALFLDGHVQALNGAAFPVVSNWLTGNMWLVYNSPAPNF